MPSAFGGITVAEAAANISAALGPCRHRVAEPVVLLTGEVVAAVCVDCLAALPPSWGCRDCEYVDMHRLGERWPHRMMGVPCEAHRR
jgi:hypothetical protein